jgi:hypothetical protein
LKLNYDDPHSNFAFKIDLRRHNEGPLALWKGLTPGLIRAMCYGGLRQELTLVHVRAQLEQLQDTVMS